MKTYEIVYYAREAAPAQEGSPISRPSVALLVGQSDRAWFEARGRRGRPRPIGRIRSVVPSSPDFDGALLDALLALWPDPFRSCPSLEIVETKLHRAEGLDFHLHADRIPPEWEALRAEARPLYERLNILRVDAAIIAPESFLVRPDRREGL